MAYNNLILDPLKKHDIAGRQTVNPIIDWIQNFGTLSDFLYLTPNREGSMSIDLDFVGLAGRILAMVEHLQAEFRGSIAGEKIKVTGGHVYFPDRTYSLADYTKNLGVFDNGKSLMIVINSTGAAYNWGELPTALVDLQAGSMTLPLVKAESSGGQWRVIHHHVGAFVFTIPPAPLISGWSASEPQTLDHPANGSFTWVSYGDCQGNAIGGNNGN